MDIQLVEMTAYGAVTDLVYALLAMLLLWLGLRYLDKANGRPWIETMDIIRSDSLATSHYYGARWIGACLIIGMLLSR